nr:PLDc N-terminal domain-containing protein [Psychrobacillus psychrodurans]
MLILPVLIIQLLLVVVALIDLLRVKNTNGSKWMWAIIIILISIIGPVIYFIVGRRNE